MLHMAVAMPLRWCSGTTAILTTSAVNGPRVQEYILAEDFPVTTCDIGCAAVGVVGYGLFRFVGQQQQVALRRVCLYNFEFHAMKI